MPPNYDYTEIEEADGILKEIPFMPSTVENIDTAFFNFIKDDLNLQTTTNKGNINVPIIWVATERSHQIKNTQDQNIRDKKGILKLPLITIERTSMNKDPNFKGVFQAHMPDHGTGYHSVRRINVPAARRINQEKTSNFSNAHSARQAGVNNNIGNGQLNFPMKKKDNTRVVMETIYMPIPIWVNTMYSLRIRTEFIQQMNDLIQPFYSFTGQAKSFFINNEGHRYEGFVEGDISYNNNVGELGEDERTYISEVKFKILGYLMGEGKNDPKPKFTVTENYVDVKIPRERVIIGDINTFLDSVKSTKGKGFFRE